MLVKEVIQGMEAGTITGKQLSEQYAISTRTISKKIKQLGYLYDNTNKTYTFIGDDLETAENTDFGLYSVKISASMQTSHQPCRNQSNKSPINPNNPPNRQQKLVNRMQSTSY